jgi:hypothetical protein
VNREDNVIADIDALITEQLNAGPHDDYHENYYPDCPQCGDDWHGAPCLHCGCVRSEGEVPKPVYVDQIQAVRRHSCDDMDFESNRLSGTAIDPHAPWVLIVDDQDDPALESRAYTIADLEAMRWGRHRSSVRNDFPRRFSDPVHSPRIRFWARQAENALYMVEGTAQILRIDWDRNGVRVAVRLDEPRQALVTDTTGPDQPTGTLVDGMISMEGATLEGFEPVGYLAPQDLEVETVSEHAWDGDRVRVLQERCEVTMRIRPDFTDPLVHRLLGQLQ